MAITQELRDYISEVRAQGIPDEQIIEELVTAGWGSADINLAISEPAKILPSPELRPALPVIDNYEPEPEKKIEQQVVKSTPEVFPVSPNKVSASPAVTSFVKPASVVLNTNNAIKTRTPWLLVFILSLFFGMVFSAGFILMYVFITPLHNFVDSIVDNKSTYVSTPKESGAETKKDVEVPAETINTQSSVSQDSQITAAAAWAVLDKSKEALKEMSLTGDVSKFNAISFKQVPSCEKGLEEDCMLTGGFLYDLDAAIETENYANVAADNKQIILSTDLVREDTSATKTPMYVYKKGFMFLAKDSSGQLKIVSLEPDKTWAVAKSVKDGEKMLSEMVVDTDGDGLTDQDENCVKSLPKCVKTDPTKLDTDGNGYWDSIDYFLKEGK